MRRARRSEVRSSNDPGGVAPATAAGSADGRDGAGGGHGGVEARCGAAGGGARRLVILAEQFCTVHALRLLRGDATPGRARLLDAVAACVAPPDIHRLAQRLYVLLGAQTQPTITC